MAGRRNWMYERFDEGSNNISQRFWSGLLEFLDYAFLVDEENGEQSVKCSCEKCKNRYYYDRETIGNHLLLKGFQPKYHVWDCHGERREINPCVYRGFGCGQISSSSSNVGSTSTTVNPLEGSEEIGGYRQMIHDAFGLHEQNSNDNNFLGNYDDDDVDVAPEKPNKKAQKLIDLMRAASQPLYDGCTDKYTKLSVMSKLLSMKSQHNISYAFFTNMMAYINEILPGEEATLPTSMWSANGMMKELALPYIKIHACENDCMLFDGTYENLDYCIFCETYRYLEHGPNEKRKAKKILHYFPITERLQRLYQSAKTAQFMTYHVRVSENAAATIGHPSQAEGWKHVNACYPEFAREFRNVRLGLCTDGFNPLSDSGKSYSMWPVFIVVYNLPPNMCMKQSYTLMSLLIPGEKSLGRNIDVFLRLLIHELQILWSFGVETWDAHRHQNFVMRAYLLWTISDFPAYGMLSGWQAHGRLACPYCMADVKSEQLRNGGKATWWGCHRIFLPRRDPLRNNCEAWVEKDRGYPSVYKSGHGIVSDLENIFFPPFGTTWDKERVEWYGLEHNWTKKSIFWKLPYWPNLKVRHCLHVMHIEKNCFDNVFYTVVNQKGKTKDNAKSRLDLQALGIRPELHLVTLPNRREPFKPNATYTLTAEQIANICHWLKNVVKLPDGYASNIGRCVNTSNNTFYNMKTHDCHVYSHSL